jgi:hypothetical protein
MVGFYVSTSFLAGQQRVPPIFAVGLVPPSGQAFNEPTFGSVEKIRRGRNHAGDDRLLFNGLT